MNLNDKILGWIWVGVAGLGMIRLTNVLHMFAKAAQIRVMVENEKAETEAAFLNGTA